MANKIFASPIIYLYIFYLFQDWEYIDRAVICYKPSNFDVQINYILSDDGSKLWEVKL